MPITRRCPWPPNWRANKCHFDGAARYKYDWLGQSLAIIHGIADSTQAQSIVAHYPHGPVGAHVGISGGVKWLAVMDGAGRRWQAAWCK